MLEAVGSVVAIKVATVHPMLSRLGFCCLFLGWFLELKTNFTYFWISCLRPFFHVCMRELQWDYSLECQHRSITRREELTFFRFILFVRISLKKNKAKKFWTRLLFQKCRLVLYCYHPNSSNVSSEIDILNIYYYFANQRVLNHLTLLFSL